MSKHHVTVEDGRVTKFVCEDDNGPCHTYPVCDCSEWSNDMHDVEHGAGHEYAHHKDCWMQWWFDNPETTIYDSPDREWDAEGPPAGMTQSGYIETEYDECVVWKFIEEEK